MSIDRSDAVVFIGATGDLAFKQIFPALHGLIRDEALELREGLGRRDGTPPRPAAPPPAWTARR